MVVLREPLLEPGDLGLRVEADAHARLGHADRERAALIGQPMPRLGLLRGLRLVGNGPLAKKEVLKSRGALAMMAEFRCISREKYLVSGCVCARDLSGGREFEPVIDVIVVVVSLVAE